MTALLPLEGAALGLPNDSVQKMPSADHPAEEPLQEREGEMHLALRELPAPFSALSQEWERQICVCPDLCTSPGCSSPAHSQGSHQVQDQSPSPCARQGEEQGVGAAGGV